MKKTFKVEGFWWLPNTPELRIPGVLSYTPGDSPKLKLMGALSNIEVRDFLSPDFINPDIIHGISAKGESVTLYKCLQSGAHSSIGIAGSQNTSQFIIQFAFFGAYFSNSSDIKFQSVSVRFNYLDSWYNRSCIQTTIPDPETEVITLKRPKPIDIQINDYVIQISILESEKINLNNTSLSTRVFINIINQEKKPFEDYLSLLRSIQNFFTFAITKPTFVIGISGKITEYIELENKNSSPTMDVTIYYAATGWQSKPSVIFWPFMLLPFSEIEVDLPELLRMWMEKSVTLKPVFDLYFAGLYQSTYLENGFLNLIQAIETYHRRISGGQYMPEEEFLEGLYLTLVAAIPQNISNDFRSSLIKGKLRYAHEYSLKRRIFLLCEHISQNLQVNFMPDKKEISSFAERITDTRNYLTHYSPELKGKVITDGKELFEMNNRLSMIIHYCILEQLGMPTQRIEMILRRDKRFQGYFT